ncbi:MAG: protein O-mannosyl-transferase family [Candidatus Limnocylindria bacterium]
MVRRARDWIAPLAVGALALGAARAALLPGLGFWDTAEFQTVAPLLGTAHPTGFPTYVLLGWLVSVLLQPLGEPAYLMNLFAAGSVAVAAAVTVDLVRALTRSTPLAVAAGIGLALTEIVWRIGTQADAHALHLALLAILVRLLVAWEDRPRGASDRALVAAAIVFALAAGNHSLTLLLAPGIGLYVLAVDPGILRSPRRIAAPAIAVLVTLVAVYAQLPLRAGPFRAELVYGRPETWDGFWAVVLAEQFRGSVGSPFADPAGTLAGLATRATTWFGPLAALIPVGAIAAILRRPRYALLSGVSLTITCLFAAGYANADIDRYYLGPTLFAWTWLALLGAAVLDALGLGPDPDPEAFGADHDDAGAPAAPARPSPGRSVVTAGVGLALAVGLLAPTVIAAPARLDRVDRSTDHAARRWVERTLAALAPDAVVVSWWSYSTPLWYAQRVEGQRPDIAIVDDRTRLDEDLGSLTDVIDSHLPSRPVYVIRIDQREIRMLEERYVLEPIAGTDASSLTRVVARRDIAP